MKRALPAWTALLIAIAVFSPAPASDKYMDVQTGDEIYASNCGNNCQSMAKQPGNCTCGVPMVKARVVKSGGDTAILLSDVWSRTKTFKIVGKYSCDCPDCKCSMVSRNPGLCLCGVEMK